MAKQNKSRAFTLVEILVTIGIIAVLAAILLPFISRAFRQSKKLRTQADFQTIAMALEAYKQDFGDIPRVAIDPINGGPQHNTGAAILGKALLGPFGDGSRTATDPPTYDPLLPYKAGDCVQYSSKSWLALKALPAGVTPVNGEYWTYFDPIDLLDGPGFRVRRGGKPYGPYLQVGKIKSQGVYLLDPDSNPIAYFAAKPGRADVTKAPAASTPGPYVDLSQVDKPAPLYDAYDNFELFRHDEPFNATDPIVLKRIQIMMGDYKPNGYIESAESETAISQPFVLWGAGPDGVFGPTGYTPTMVAADNAKAVNDCDDVTNFK